MSSLRSTLVALALLPLPALAATAGDARALRQEIAAQQLDRALALTPSQAQALLPVLQTAAAGQQSARTTHQAALVAALTQARDELVAGGAVSDATRQALVAARQATWQGLRPQRQALRQQVEALLTPAQVQSLRQVQLGVASGASRGPGRGGVRRPVLWRALTSDPFLALVQARTA